MSICQRSSSTHNAPHNNKKIHQLKDKKYSNMNTTPQLNYIFLLKNRLFFHLTNPCPHEGFLLDTKQPVHPLIKSMTPPATANFAGRIIYKLLKNTPYVLYLCRKYEPPSPVIPASCKKKKNGEWKSVKLEQPKQLSLVMCLMCQQSCHCYWKTRASCHTLLY